MKTYLTLFVVALSSSLMLTPIVRRLAQRLGWVDVPKDGRRLHELPIPRVGGVAVFISVVFPLSLLLLVNNLVTASLTYYSEQTIAVLASCTLVFLFGVFDDLVGVSPKWKFAAQAAAGTLLYFLGGQIHAINVPFFGEVGLATPASFALTMVWVVGISNAFNLIDGLDGLASGASLFAALVMLVVSLFMGHTLAIVITLALAGALIGFLRYNLNPASIFLGDSGALFIGFLLAALSLLSAQKASTAVAVAIPLMAFGLPVIDTGFTIARRLLSGKPLFEGDREHIHHKLLERGWSQRRVAFVLYGVCAVFGIVALMFVSDQGGGRTTGLLLLVTGAAVVLVAGRLRYHEVDEVRASVKRNVIDRRVRAANNIAVRRATLAMAKASTLGELFAAVEEVVTLGEFVYVTVQLGRDGDEEGSRRALATTRDTQSLRGACLRGGLIHWEWGRGGVESSAILNSHLYWTMRLPLWTDTAGWGFITFYRSFGGKHMLLDVNYLSGFFQREMALAAERVFNGSPARASQGSEPLGMSATVRG